MSLDDLWALKHILAQGDIVGAKTTRTLAVEEAARAPTFLKIIVDHLFFDESGQHLKISGRIAEAAEKFTRGWHTLIISTGDTLQIEKPAGWKESEKRRLQDALTYRVLNFLICVIDERQTDFAIATELRLKHIATIKSGAGKRAEKLEEKMGQYFKEVIDLILEHLPKIAKIIIAGPGFARENLWNRFPEEIKAKAILGDASVTGLAGLNEVIKRGTLDKVAFGTRISKETELVERFLTELGRQSELVRWKEADVEAAAEIGAINLLIVSDRLLRKENIEKIMEKTESMRGSVHIINSTHEAGERLLGLGGLGAFLRYKI